MGLLIGLDVGTTSTIGVLAAPDGRIVAERSRPVRLYSEHPGWAEQDAAEWWANACAILRELATIAGTAKLLGIGVAGMVPALVLLDAQGRVLRRSIQQSDGRTGAELEALRGAVDERAFFRRTGCGVSQQLIAPKLRWLARHEPETFGRIATVFGSYDYITWKLTGVRGVEHNWALESGLMALAERRFAADLAALGGIGLQVLPPVRASHEVVGAVTPQAAAMTGLPAGLPVVAGSADHVASAFMAGVALPGDVLLKFGGAGDILTASEHPPDDPRLYLDFHIVPGLFMPNGCMATSGAVLNWFAREFAADLGDAAHATLDAAAAAVPAGAEGLVMLPYLLGEKTPLHDPAARGVLFGLGLHHRRAHLWRALLEAVAFGFRHHLEVFAEAGLPVRRLIASDGGARSRVWMQIAADALQRPVALVEGHTGSSLGAAYVAGVAVGALPGWYETGRFVRPGAVIMPQPAHAAVYDARYRVYRELYGRLRPLFPALA
jgi:xylulokinase